MPNALITGAGGFLGSHLANHLDGEFSVTAVTRRPIPFADSIDQVQADLSLPDWTDALDTRADTVVHLVQSREYRNFPEGADDMLKVNVQSTVKLLDWARENEANRFILASTGSVYAPQARPLHEEDLCEPSSFYAATKLSAEMLCRQYANEMEIVIVRFFGIYGPGQSRNLVAQVVERVRKGVPVTLAGEDGLEINLLYLDDAAEVVRRLAIAPDLDSPFVVNAGHAHPASIRAIAEAAAAVLDCEPLYEYSEDNALNLTCDTSKLHNLYKPTTDLEAGIRNSIEREPVALA